jgi:hypothetical protein
MPSLINHPNAQNFTFRFRAFCRDDNYLGKWRLTEEEAKADTGNHKAKDGNNDHVVEIEIEQKYTVAVTD